MRQDWYCALALLKISVLKTLLSTLARLVSPVPHRLSSAPSALAICPASTQAAPTADINFPLLPSTCLKQENSKECCTLSMLSGWRHCIRGLLKHSVKVLTLLGPDIAIATSTGNCRRTIGCGALSTGKIRPVLPSKSTNRSSCRLDSTLDYQELNCSNGYRNIWGLNWGQILIPKFNT